MMCPVCFVKTRCSWASITKIIDGKRVRGFVFNHDLIGLSCNQWQSRTYARSCFFPGEKFSYVAKKLREHGYAMPGAMKVREEELQHIWVDGKCTICNTKKKKLEVI